MELRERKASKRRPRKHWRHKDDTVESEEGEAVRMSRQASQTQNVAQKSTSPGNDQRMPTLPMKRFPSSLRALLRGLKAC